MERIEERVPGSDYQQLQYFLSDSRWDYRAVNQQIAHDADHHLGGYRDTCLLIDESGMPKKGIMSVGVARQWCGQLGKTDNCQVGVFAVLGRERYSAPIDCRLYLPDEWTDDKDRCIKAKVPEENIVFRTKPELAFEMVLDARNNGVRFSWVGFDGLYGNTPWLLRSLDEAGEIFVADVHKNQQVYLEDPEPFVPPRKSNKGRVPSKLQSKSEAIRVDKLIGQEPESAWKRVKVRDSSKGELQVEILHKRVWLWDGEEEGGHHWHLIVRREINSPNKIKYSLSNAPVTTSKKRLVYMQGQRYWVERSFQDGKTQCGMGEYQARGWFAWHHHMTMVMLGQLFMLEERLLHKEGVELLSCGDITSLLKYYLPRRDVTEQEIFRQMELRHAKRQASIDAALRKQHSVRELSP